MDMGRISLNDILMGYLDWRSIGYLGISWDILVGYLFGDVAKRYPVLEMSPKDIQISIRYPSISFSLLSSPTISQDLLRSPTWMGRALRCLQCWNNLRMQTDSEFLLCFRFIAHHLQHNGSVTDVQDFKQQCISRRW